MKKIIVGLLPLALVFGCASAANPVFIGRNPVQNLSSCNSSESHDRYYYIPADKSVTIHPDDTYWNTNDAFIRKDSSVEVYENGVISQCSSWERISNIVRGGGSSTPKKYPALIFRNYDGCVLNKPNYTKTNNPTAIDAQIHYTVKFNLVGGGVGEGKGTNKGQFFYNDGDGNYSCYPNWNVVSSTSGCVETSANYRLDQHEHKGECLNYRVFRCGDGLIDRPDGTNSYDNGTYDEECDPNHPDRKNGEAGQTCNPNTCKIEYDTPVCSSTYNNKKVYTSNSTPYLKGLDSENLCNLGKLTQNSFKRTGTPIQYTWGCTNGTKSTSPDGCNFEQYRCGDGKLNGSDISHGWIDGKVHNEECDPSAPEWKNRSDGQVCNEDCTYAEAVCGPASSTTAVYNQNYPTSRIKESELCKIGKLKEGSFSGPDANGKYTWICINGTNETKPCGAQDARCGDEKKNGNEQCDYKDTVNQEGWGGKWERCNDKCERESIPQSGPVCNSSFSGHTEYTTYSTDWLNKNSGLCTRGEVTDFKSEWSAGNQRKFTWKCSNDDLDIVCTAKQEWCGDGIKNGNEKCDPKDTKDKKGWGDGCSNTCEPTYNDAVCGSSYHAHTGYLTSSYSWLTEKTQGLCDKGKVIYFEDHYPSTLGHTYTWQCQNGTGDYVKVSDTCRQDLQWCGDGTYQKDYEQCDFADSSETNWGNDGCDSSCKQKNEKTPSSCDEKNTFHYILRSGYQYTFYDKFIPGGTRYLYDFNVIFKEKNPYDYNRGLDPTFSWMDDLGNGVYKTVSTTTRVLKSTKYQIWDHPAFGDSTYDDIYIEYNIKYSDKIYSTKPDDSKLKTHKECAYYKISRCGDGNLDEDWEGRCDKNGNCKEAEQCDPGSEGTKVLPDGRICNSECKIVDVPEAVCNSKYNGQVVDNLTGGDHLCETGTYSEFKFNETTNTWTWKCNNIAGKGTDCSATKALKGDWKIVKTLKTTGEVKTGDTLVWEIKVTALSGDVKNLAIKDTMPDILSYKNNSVKITSNPDNIKILKETVSNIGNGKNNEVVFDTEGTLHNENSIVLTLETLVNEMPQPGVEYKNVACSKPEDKTDWKCDDEPIPAKCNSDYSGKTFKTLEAGDYLCKVGKITKFTTTSTGWTWECNNEKSTDKCYAIRPSEGTGVIKKTLQDKDKIEVKDVGQILKWEVKVTASGGDISDFGIWDKLPNELNYLGWSYKDNEKPEGINITKKDQTKPEGDITIHYWDVEGTLKEGNSFSIIVKTEVKEMPKAGENILNIACIAKDDKTIDCDDDETNTPEGELIIEKTLQNKKFVSSTGELLEWQVKVTASGGTVTGGFKISDIVPFVLSFTGDYEIISNKDNLKMGKRYTGTVSPLNTWKGENLVGEVWTLDVDGVLTQGESLVLKLKTIVVKMPKNDEEYRNVACVIKDGKTDCDDDETETPKGKLDVVKTLISETKYVTHTGQELKWKVTVTALSGDVEMQWIEDNLPNELAYSGYSRGHVPAGITISEPTGTNGKHITWATTGTLKSGDYIELNVITTVVAMPNPNETIQNVACAKPDPGDKECGTGHIAKLRLKKFVWDSKNNKWAKSITGKAGDPITYKIEFGNDKSSDVTVDNITIKDFLPKNVSFSSGSININNAKHSSGTQTTTGEWNGFKFIDGVHIEIYGGISLAPGGNGTIILTGEISKNNTGYRQNFACIYSGDDIIACDDAVHKLDNPVMCSSNISKTYTDNICDGSTRTVNVTCSSVGGIADSIELICDKTVQKSGTNISSLTGSCVFGPNVGTYTIQCKVNGSTGSVNNCEGAYTITNSCGGSSTCFIAGTKVLMGDGETRKKIEDIITGDTVMGKEGPNEVLGFDRPKLGERTLWKINNEGEFFVSEEHPFLTTEGWKSFNPEMTNIEIENAKKNKLLREDEELSIIGELEEGDILITYNGKKEITRLEMDDTHSPDTQLYNLMLTGDHTYYANGYLVHNKGGGGGGGSSTRCESLKEESGKLVCRTNDRDAYMSLWCYNGENHTRMDETEKGDKKSILKLSSNVYNYSSCEEIRCYISDSYPAADSNINSYCKYTPEKKEPVDVNQKCFNINGGNFSIEEGEIFPFYWNLHNMEKWVEDNKINYVEIDGDYRKAPTHYRDYANLSEPCSYCDNYEDYDDCLNTCKDGKVGKIATDSMVCTFMIYDSEHTNDPLYTLEGPCLAKNNPLTSNSLINAWYARMLQDYCGDAAVNMDCYFSWNPERVNDRLLPSAVYYIQSFGSGASIMLDAGDGGQEWEFIRKNEANKSYGEYRIVLDSIKYLTINEYGEWEQKSSDSNDLNFAKCGHNFVLTNSYTVQKTPSGNLTASKDALKKYLYCTKYESDKCVKYFEVSNLLNAITTSDYKENSAVKTAMENFKDKYQKLAVSVDTSGKLKKVPGKNIYFVSTDIPCLGSQCSKSIDLSKPTTIVQTQGNTTIKGNLDSNLMLLTEGFIIFEDANNCTEAKQKRQTVKGIFYAEKGLKRSGVLKNNDINEKKWCTEGGLTIKGVVIGKGLDQMMKDSRSNLNYWFDDAKGGKNANTVMNGASVLIEYSPSVFTKSTMPPGAEDFTTALSIYKN